MTTASKAKGLGIFLLAMLIISAIDSIRNLPATALFGSALIFFFILSAIIFLIPVALISAELSASWPEKSGIYHWTHLAFGEKMAFLAIWLQWINTMVWFPTILSFIAGTLSFLINPALANNKIYLISIILGTFWLLTLINLKGIQISARIAAICTIIGVMIPLILIIYLAIVWVASGEPTQIHLNLANLIPSFNRTDSWISLTAIMSAFLGIELASVHVKNVVNPQKTFPRALLISSIFILVSMVLGSLAIALVLPTKQINLVDGVMQEFTAFFTAYHLKWLVPVLAVMILVGSFGGVINWIISPAKGLLQAAQHHFLPHFLQKENKHGVASRLLITQAILVSLICLAFLLMPTVNGSYWLLTDLSTQLYMLMYVILFISALVIKHKFPHQPSPYKIPGGKSGLWLTGLLGLIGCLITLWVGFFPPSGINVGSTLHYELLFVGGMIVMIVPVVFFYIYRAAQRK